MGRGRTNRSEFAKGPFVNITARVPLGVWTMIEQYAQKHTGGNRSVAIERMIRECEAQHAEWRLKNAEERGYPQGDATEIRAAEMKAEALKQARGRTDAQNA